MKKLLILSFLISSLAFARTNNQVYVMPPSGNVPGWGQVNLGSSSAVTGESAGACYATSSSSALQFGTLPVGDIPYDNLTLDQSGGFLEIKPGGVTGGLLGNIAQNTITAVNMTPQSISGAVEGLATSALNANTITYQNMAPRGAGGGAYQVADSGTNVINGGSTTSTNFVGINNAFGITCTARPLIMMMYSANGGSISCSATTSCQIGVSFDGNISQFITTIGVSGFTPIVLAAPTWIQILCPAGGHTLQFDAKVVGGGSMTWNNVGLLVYEL